MDDEYTIGELATAAGVTPRTIRYYVSSGILPGPRGAGVGARYSKAHLDRLRVVRNLQREHQPLSEIHARLEALSDDDVASLVTGPAVRPTQSALEYIRGVLGAASTAEPAAAYGAPAVVPGVRTSTDPPPAEAAGGPVRSQPTAAGPAGQLEGPAHAAAGRAEATAAFAVDAAAPSQATTRGRLPFVAPLLHARRPVLPVDREPTEVPPSPDDPAYLSRSQWDRIALTPNVELHIRRPLSRLENRRVERLLTLAREILRKDEP